MIDTNPLTDVTFGELKGWWQYFIIYTFYYLKFLQYVCPAFVIKNTIGKLMDKG